MKPNYDLIVQKLLLHNNKISIHKDEVFCLVDQAPNKNTSQIKVYPNYLGFKNIEIKKDNNNYIIQEFKSCLN